MKKIVFFPQMYEFFMQQFTYKCVYPQKTN